MLNLLYNSAPIPAPVAKLDSLMLGKILAAVTPDIRLQNAAREVIERPLSDVWVINYRREIIRDFTARKLPIERISELFGRFGDISGDYRDEKSRMFRLFGGKKDNAQLLTAAAGAVKKLCGLINEIYDIFRDRFPESEGLNALKDRISTLAESQDIIELYNLADKFSDFSASDNITESEIIIDENGKIECLGALKTQKNFKAQKRAFGKKSASSFVRAALFSDEAAGMISTAVKELCEAFEHVITSVCSEFLQIRYDLGFYSFAVKYCNGLKSKGFPGIYAKLGSDTDIRELYDPYLLLTLPDAKSVVPNCFRMPGGVNGMIITGKNSSGKTVYLRAATLAIIFTASGLPIAAKSAEIEIPSKILIQMASEERSYRDGDIVGRFEEEVAEMKNTVEQAGDRALIILNEVFQTTDYAEGAEGMYYILKYLNRCGAKWAAITHLKRLEEMFEDEGGIIRIREDATVRYRFGEEK